ncbi:hypothetical protein D3C86_2143320 [compost metagenome]
MLRFGEHIADHGADTLAGWIIVREDEDVTVTYTFSQVLQLVRSRCSEGANNQNVFGKQAL